MQLYDKVKIEAIKLAVSGLYVIGVSTKDILLESIHSLREQYEWTKEECLLYKAVHHIYAYIELGYPFEDGSDVFEVISNYLKLDMRTVFPEKIWKYTQIKLSKSKIRNMIGRWNPRFQSMKIDDVVKDIYDNVSNHRIGDYLYHTGKVLVKDNNDILWQQTYWLHIREDEAVFHDVIKNKYYIFEEYGVTND